MFKQKQQYNLYLILQLTSRTKASHINIDGVKRIAFYQAFPSFLKQYLDASATILLHLPVVWLGHSIGRVHHCCGPGLIVK